MADYRPDWDSELESYSRKWLKKHPRDLTVDELHLIRSFIVAEKRLKRVDDFLWSLR